MSVILSVSEPFLRQIRRTDMPQKKTKKRLTKAERRRIKRQQRLMKIGLGLIFTVGFGILVMIPFLNAADSTDNDRYTTASNVWYVQGGDMEIAAVERQQAQDAMQVAQELIPTQMPTRQPTPIPTAVPTEAPTPEPTAEPTPTPLPTPEPRPENVVTITAVGDCTLGGDTNGTGGDKRFASYVQKYGYDYFLDNVRHIFESDDLTIVNLEGPLTTSRHKSSRQTFNFIGPPEYVNILSGSSVEIANVANNHALDFGKEGLAETKKVLENAGIGVSGFTAAHFTEVNGVKVGSIGFTEIDFEPEDIVKAVKIARKQCDLLLVSMHWGNELTYSMPNRVKRLGHQIIDAGADLVIGTHSHCYGEIEKYKGKYVIYSLGNFCFGGNKNPTEKFCTIFQQTFKMDENGRIVDGGINIIPAAVTSNTEYNNYQPTVLTGQYGKTVLAEIAKLSNLTEKNTLWMENSYVVENNIVTVDGGKQEESVEETDAFLTPETEIAL